MASGRIKRGHLCQLADGKQVAASEIWLSDRKVSALANMSAASLVTRTDVS
jgi:hypothetical protein